MIDCAQCGLELPRPAGDIYGEDDEIVCSDCKATNHISIDEGDGEGPQAYVSRFTCRHGTSEDELCDRCETERPNVDGKGV